MIRNWMIIFLFKIPVKKDFLKFSDQKVQLE